MSSEMFKQGKTLLSLTTRTFIVFHKRLVMYHSLDFAQVRIIINDQLAGAIIAETLGL